MNVKNLQNVDDAPQLLDHHDDGAHETVVDIQDLLPLPLDRIHDRLENSVQDAMDFLRQAVHRLDQLAYHVRPKPLEQLERGHQTLRDPPGKFRECVAETHDRVTYAVQRPRDIGRNAAAEQSSEQ